MQDRRGMQRSRFHKILRLRLIATSAARSPGDRTKLTKCPPYLLLAASLAFADNPNANLGPLMANTATSQMISMLPLFVFATGIAVFFALVQKNPQKAAIGCGGLCAIAFILGLFIWVLDFIKRRTRRVFRQPLLRRPTIKNIPKETHKD